MLTQYAGLEGRTSPPSPSPPLPCLPPLPPPSIGLISRHNALSKFFIPLYFFFLGNRSLVALPSLLSSLSSPPLLLILPLHLLTPSKPHGRRYAAARRGQLRPHALGGAAQGHLRLAGPLPLALAAAGGCPLRALCFLPPLSSSFCVCWGVYISVRFPDSSPFASNRPSSSPPVPSFLSLSLALGYRPRSQRHARGR